MSFNYIGSKKKLIDFIDTPIKDIITSDTTFLDAFAGTGIVGSSFERKYNCNIIANDMEYYSYIINYALLCVPFTKKLDKIIKTINTLQVKNTEYKLIVNNYSPDGDRLFWTKDNAFRCDFIRYYIDKLLEKTSITQSEHIYLVACLLAAMDKRANTTSVYGAFLKQFKKSAIPQIVIEPIHRVEKMNPNNQVYNLNINSSTIYERDYDIVYLDPPYNERMYSSNYHPLNYIAHYKDLSIYGKTGLITDYNKSKYCHKSNAFEMLTELIENLKTKHIILSYNNEGIMKLDDIKKLFMSKGNLTLYKKIYKKYKSNKTQEDENVYELLYHCEISSTSELNTFNEIILV